MMRGLIVVLGLCALGAYLVSRRTLAFAAQPQSDDLHRWEDDGGHLPEVEHGGGSLQPTVTVDIHST